MICEKAFGIYGPISRNIQTVGVKSKKHAMINISSTLDGKADVPSGCPSIGFFSIPRGLPKIVSFTAIHYCAMKPISN